METERGYVKDCQSQWNYLDLKDTLTIKIIYFHEQWGHSLVHFPNFFIGINPESDTIGIIDYDFDGNIELGSRIRFEPGKSRMTDKSGFVGHKPALSVSAKRKHNKINCNIKNVYYATLKN